jgi:hypothetical protein
LHLESPLPEDFAGNRLKLAPRQCKAIAIDFGSAIAFGKPDVSLHPTCRMALTQWLNTA